MGKPKKGQATLSTSTCAKSEEIITMRARRIDSGSRSEMLAKIVHWWLASGAPPVDEVDAAHYCRIDEMLAIETAKAVREWHGWSDVLVPLTSAEQKALVDKAYSEQKQQASTLPAHGRPRHA